MLKNGPNAAFSSHFATKRTLLKIELICVSKIFCLRSLQVAKDNSVEKLIDKIKNWYFEKEGKICYFILSQTLTF